MQDIDDLIVDDLFEAVQEPKLDEAEQQKLKEAKRQALRSKIRAKRSVRNGKVTDITDASDLANIVDSPGMSDIMNKLLKGNNLDLLTQSLGTDMNKNAKTLSKIVHK